MFPPRSVPACVPSEPDGLGLSRSAAQARKRASGRAHRLRELSRISRVPGALLTKTMYSIVRRSLHGHYALPVACRAEIPVGVTTTVTK
jgi:hypothetical protein